MRFGPLITAIVRYAGFWSYRKSSQIAQVTTRLYGTLGTPFLLRNEICLPNSWNCIHICLS